MPIEFRCSQCNQLLRVPENSAGKAARCPKCQALMTVPAGEGNLPVAAIAPTSGAPAAPAPTPPGNPFADGGAPPTPPLKNPFGEQLGASPFAAGGSGSLNPYASPAAASFAPLLRTPEGQRFGLPWEYDRPSFGCWFRTVSLVLGSPTYAFSAMRQYGGLGKPILYGIYGTGMPMAVGMTLAIPIVLLFVFAGGRDNLAVAAAGGALAAVGILAFGAIYVLAIATIGMMIAAAIWHVSLLLCGGAKEGFETTFRVTTYVYSSLMWLNFIPYIGGCVGLIWIIVLLIIGFSRAHEVSTGKTALAVLLPFGLCMGAYVVFVALAASGAFGR